VTPIESKPQTPGEASAEAIIAAPAETVWRLLSSLDRWPQWKKSIKRIHVAGPNKEGTRFVCTGRRTTTSELREVVSSKRLVWSGRAFGFRAVHTCELKALNNFTHVRTTETFEGPLPSIFPRLMQKKMSRELEQCLTDLKLELDNLKKENSRQSVGPTSPAQSVAQFIN
jgi:uncharacterized protein YndB with AHSA1/START domain